MNRSSWPLAALAAATLLTGCEDDAGNGDGAAAHAPQSDEPAIRSLVDRLEQANRLEGFGAYVACIAPDDRPMLSYQLMTTAEVYKMFAGFAAGAKDSQVPPAEQIEAVFKKYDLPDAAMLAGLLQRYRDQAQIRAIVSDQLKDVHHVAFCEELVGVLKQLGNKGSAGAAPEISGDLGELTIDGETASARLDGEATQFVKVEGEWFLSIPDAPLQTGPTLGEQMSPAALQKMLQNANR